jgi:hypothetical protein
MLTPSHCYTTPEKTYFSLLPFIILMEYILIVQGGFALVLQVCIYHVFIKLTPSPLLFTHSLSPCSPNFQQFTVLCIMLYLLNVSFDVLLLILSCRTGD